jgi:polysaccharide export outer membrane protein
MQTHRIPGQRFWFLTILSFTCSASHIANAQDLPAQKVGGISTFDTNPGLSGSDTSSGRQRLSTLTAVPEDFFVLKLAPGFLLAMQVYDVPELTSDLRVDANGDVTVPTIGVVHVAGKTIPEAQTEIARRLKAGEIIKNPQVTLNVQQYAGQNISVVGEVHNPGRLELLAPHNLGDVLALVGGETQYAGNQIDIKRQVDGAPKELHIHYAQNRKDSSLDEIMVQPGDVITVRRAGIVYVLGGVSRPGGYLMQEDGGLTVTQALSLAYGTIITASMGSIRVVRKGPDGSVTEIPVAFKDMVNGKVPPLPLQAEDIVYVPISKTKTIATSGILAASASAAILVR